MDISQRVFDAYFDLKAKRANIGGGHVDVDADTDAEDEEE